MLKTASREREKMRSAGGDEDDPQLSTRAQQKKRFSEEVSLSLFVLKPYFEILKRGYYM